MPEWVLQLAAMAGGGVATYAAIRADLATLHENLRHVEKATDEAHRRIDEFASRRAGARCN